VFIRSIVAESRASTYCPDGRRCQNAEAPRSGDYGDAQSIYSSIVERDWQTNGGFPMKSWFPRVVGFAGWSGFWAATLWVGAASAQSQWDAKVLPTRLTVGYAVRAADLSGNGRPDLVIVDAKRIVWLENPTWTEHVIWETPDARFDNVCCAIHDIDGDGRLDLAVGYDWQPNNTGSGGAVGWLQSPADPRQPWTWQRIVGEEPTMHRMYWADFAGDGQVALVTAPLKGRGTTAPGWDSVGVRLSAWEIPAALRGGQTSAAWTSRVLESSLPVMHNLQVVDWEGDGRQELLLASFRGVHLWIPPRTAEAPRLVHLGAGHQEAAAPGLGASEIRLGNLGGGRRFLGTIEPWHGNQVVVYEQPVDVSDDQILAGQTPLWTRRVLDDQLQWGHAVACANLDDDPEDELVIGVRDNLDAHRCGVRIYDRQPSGQWQRTLVNPGEVAVEDLIVEDLDGDGRPEIIAVGRATGNVVIYRQRPDDTN
jgi:hypothetical protein